MEAEIGSISEIRAQHLMRQRHRRARRHTLANLRFVSVAVDEFLRTLDEFLCKGCAWKLLKSLLQSCLSFFNGCVSKRNT